MSMENQDDKKQTLVSAVGENYEYIKTIINNKFEIRKLELLSKGGTTLSSIVLFLVLFIIFFLITQILLVLAVFALYAWIGSYIYALLSLAGILLLIGLMIFLLRKRLIYRTIENKIISLIDSTENIR